MQSTGGSTKVFVTDIWCIILLTLNTKELCHNCLGSENRYPYLAQNITVANLINHFQFQSVVSKHLYMHGFYLDLALVKQEKCFLSFLSFFFYFKYNIFASCI